MRFRGGDYACTDQGQMRVKKACGMARRPDDRPASVAGFALEAAVDFGLERVAGLQPYVVAGFNWTRR